MYKALYKYMIIAVVGGPLSSVVNIHDIKFMYCTNKKLHKIQAIVTDITCVETFHLGGIFSPLCHYNCSDHSHCRLVECRMYHRPRRSSRDHSTPVERL